jgi:hypothetical protein
MVMSRNSTKWAKPVCQECRNRPVIQVEGQPQTTMDSVLDQLLGEVKK